MIPNTLNIFKQLYQYLPPLVPDNIRTDMKEALIQLEHNPHLTIEEVEDTMISFGKKIWPYRKAYHEIVDVYEGKIGETMLVSALPKSIQKKYGEFIAHGGTYRDFVAGGAATEFFEPEERIALTKVLVSVRDAIYQHARQAALSTDITMYQKKIEEFSHVQAEIDAVFEQLHSLADAEQEHPELASEIRAHIRGFEYGLAALGPQASISTMAESIDYFASRKEFKKMRP
jgi:hypothetical protein